MKNLILLVAVCLPLILTSGCNDDKVETDPNREAIVQMKAVVDSLIGQDTVPGIVALVVDRQRGIDWLYTAGYSDLVAKTPMDPEYVFRIGSNTKTMTGTVLLQLVDENKLKLEDKLSKFFPQYEKADIITVRMLCNMTSGIVNYSMTAYFDSVFGSDPHKVWHPEELVDVAFQYPFYFEPGTGFHYSNTNTILLGMIIEKLTGNSLEHEITSRLLVPQGLVNSGFLTSGIQLPGNHAKGYYAGAYEEGADYTERIDVSWGWAAGSAYSTPRELQKYIETVVDGGYLSDTLQNRRLTEMANLPAGDGYGLCLVHRGSFYGHNGSIPGFNSAMYHSKDKNATFIIYFNCQYNLVSPDYLVKRFRWILYKE